MPVSKLRQISLKTKHFILFYLQFIRTLLFASLLYAQDKLGTGKSAVLYRKTLDARRKIFSSRFFNSFMTSFGTNDLVALFASSWLLMHSVQLRAECLSNKFDKF